MIDDLKYFRHKLKLVVRFSDLDAIGHVNNSCYLTYSEEARIDYFRTVFGIEPESWQFDTVLAHINVDFIKPIFLGDEITIFTRCIKIGRKSTTYKSLFVRTNAASSPVLEVVARVKAIQVAFGYKTQESMENQPHQIEKILEFESATSRVEQ